MSASLNIPVEADMNGGIVPPLWSYALFNTAGTTFDIELINEKGQTIKFLEGCTLAAATATTLRAACASNADFDLSVGAIIRPVADILFNTCVINDFTIPSGLAPKATTIGKFSAGTSIGISWGG